MWSIYKHTTPSDRVYIGITSNNPIRRWKNKTEEEFKKASENRKGKGTKSVICVETSQIFNSVKETADYFKVHYRTLSSHLHGKLKSCAGFHFKFLKIT